MKYDNKSITVAGAELLSQDLANKQSTIIEQMVVSDKQPSDLSNISQLTLNDFADALYYPVPIIHHQANTFQPSGLITNNNVIVTDANKALLTNIQSNNGQQVGDLANNYDIQMVGLVGHTEGQNNNALVAVAIADDNEAFTIPANTDIPYQLFFDIAVGYSNATNVTVNINNAGYITQADLVNTLSTYVSIDGAQTITGNKSFTGDLQYKGSEVATLSDVALQYQNAVNTANSYANSLMSNAHTTTQSSGSGSSTNSAASNNNQNPIPSWIPSSAIELPNGWSVDNEDGKQTYGQWYYIRPLNVSGYKYANVPTGQYALDSSQWYLLRSDIGFNYNNFYYYQSGGQATWVFNRKGFVTESSEDGLWSNTPYTAPNSTQPVNTNPSNTSTMPSWIPAGAIELPNGWSLDNEDGKQIIGQWYYIRPLNVSGYQYADMPIWPYKLDPSQWYILRSDTGFTYNGNQYINGGGKNTWVFNSNGFYTESSEDDAWSNASYVPAYNPTPVVPDNDTMPTAFPTDSTLLPYGTNLTNLPSSDTWYYIKPNTLSNYTNLPTGQYALDNNTWYMLNYNVNQDIQWGGVHYIQNNVVYIFNPSGPVTEATANTSNWSNGF